MSKAPERDEHGRFVRGHKIGAGHRFRAGRPSANPRGRSWGTNKWTRVLRLRRYAKHELEDVLADVYAPTNQREAAMRLLLPMLAEDPPKPRDLARRAKFLIELRNEPTAELRLIVVDPRQEPDRRAAAHRLLVERDQLLVPERW